MTTYAFNPINSTTPPWKQQIVLDNDPYVLSAYWNLYAQRWYVNLATQDGTLVQYSPLIGSPLDYDIPLFPGLFTASTVIYRADSGTIEVTP